jgi:uncharacterized protein YbjT (DUF2867 family)
LLTLLLLESIAMAAKKLFLIGPGFIGRAVLDLLKAEGRYDITCLSRRPEYSLVLQGQAFRSVEGSLDDFKVIARASQESDVVIHAATADHLPSVLAVLEGIRRKLRAGKAGGTFSKFGAKSYPVVASMHC